MWKNSASEYCSGSSSSSSLVAVVVVVFAVVGAVGVVVGLPLAKTSSAVFLVAVVADGVVVEMNSHLLACTTGKRSSSSNSRRG